MVIIPLMLYILKFLLYRTVFPLVKGKKDSIKLIRRDWRSETSLTAFPLSGFSVKAGTVSPILYSVCRATFHRFLILSASGGQYFSLLQRILELLRSSVSAIAYTADRTVIRIRFVKQNTCDNLKGLSQVATSILCLNFSNDKP